MYNKRPHYLLALGILLLFGGGCLGTGTQPTTTTPNGTDGMTSPTTTEPDDAPSTSPITMSAPAAYATVTSPVTVSGMVPGNWATEGQLYISIETDDGTVVGETTAMVDTWMTTELVPFSTMVSFDTASNTNAELRIHKGNPSGFPENDMTIAWPILLEASSTVSLGSWENKQLTEVGISLMVPNEFAMIETQGGVQFQYTGPSQREATELYDGVTLTLDVFDGAANTAAQAASDQYDQDDTSGVKRSIDGTVRQTTIGSGINAYTYQYTSLGVIDRYFFETENTVVMLSIVSPDPDGRGYDGIVKQIRDSITVLE